MKFSKLFLVALTGAVFFVSCNSDDDKAPQLPLGDYDNGFLVLNQGNFGTSNSDITFISDNLTTQQNGIFSLVNPTMTMGDTGQDVGLYEDLAFIVLNGSNTIQVVNRYTFESVATVSTGLSNPRYIAFANGKGYVTNWGNGSNPEDDFVAVLDLTSYAVTTTIPVVEGPERIIEEDATLYVAHQGGYGYGNSISVISAVTNTVTSTISVGDVPNSLDVEDGVLYVLCAGKALWTNDETIGSLYQINLNGNQTTNYAFPEGAHPSNLVIEDNKIYYTVDSDIFAKATSAALPTTPLFSTTSQGVYGVYSFAVENDKIYVGDAVDYNSNGKIYIYSLTGTLQNEYSVGVTPAGFYFNN
jgi:YVTN family beta-propeller protein